jgi:hypothetical protein
MLKNINRAKIVMPLLITITLLILLFFTLLATVNYSVESVNWGDFFFSTFYWVSGRMIYFPLGVEIGEQNKEVKVLENTISSYRNAIYRSKTNKPIAEKFKFKNTLSKASAYLNLLDLQLNKLSDKQSSKAVKKCNLLFERREQVIDFIDKFEKKEKYRGKFNIDIIRVKYDILDFGTCFSYGNDTRAIGHKYKININNEGIKKSVPAFVWSLFMSFMSASISILQYGFTWTALVMFMIKLVLFLMGCYNGLTLGKSVIEEDKYNVLLNITEAVKEIITEVEQETGIIITSIEEKKAENLKLELQKG